MHGGGYEEDGRGEGKGGKGIRRKRVEGEELREGIWKVMTKEERGRAVIRKVGRECDEFKPLRDRSGVMILAGFLPPEEIKQSV